MEQNFRWYIVKYKTNIGNIAKGQISARFSQEARTKMTKIADDFGESKIEILSVEEEK